MVDNPEGRPRTAVRIAAVRYLNTLPLAWGMLHGPQQGRCELAFVTPAECAELLAAGEADAGIVPVVEVQRLGAEILPGVCIASRGPVRSILLVSKGPFSRIRTLAADEGSRTSTLLARLVLAERFGTEPEVVPMAPDLPAMLAKADSALLIGDAALRFDPSGFPGEVLDLGAEWTRWTGRPMVFAVWAARPGLDLEGLAGMLQASAEFGLGRIDEIVRAEAPPRRIPEELALAYLKHHIRYHFGKEEREGMELFLEMAKRAVAV